MDTYAFTVFTPTYNRAQTLPRVWNSLKQQTFRDFEWVIVDDGSYDNTHELVSKWKQESTFPIVYLWQEHGHKKTACNLAVREARGALFLTLDSDDECVPTALERLWWHWQNIPADLHPGFSAVTVLCAYPGGKIVGDRFPCTDWLDSDSIELFHRWRVRGEKWGFQRTDIMRQFPFPEYIVGFVPEGVVWTQISLKYKTRFVNEVLRTYHQSTDSLTRSRHPTTDTAAGMAFWFSTIFQNEWRYFRHDPKWFVKCAINFTRFHLHSGDSPFCKAFRLRWTAGALILLMYPWGYLAHLVDRFRR
jgi:glycosyltransferase involved in cell wall biosynthesis